jgi:ubiquinone/menaquinone biosynthesis C-methylase UbiE
MNEKSPHGADPIQLNPNRHPITALLANIIEKAGAKQWQASDFAGIDQLHLGARDATQALASWLPCSAKHGLDIGCGVGGTSRYLALNHGCSMVGLDLNGDYIQAAQLINGALSPPPDCDFVMGNSLDLPFAGATFDFVVSQHASMNIAQKAALLAVVHRVIKPGGCLLLHEVMLAQGCAETSVNYPTPWADTLDHSHLSHWQNFAKLAHIAGFTLTEFADNTRDALAWMQETRKQRPKLPFTPQLALGATAGNMSANMHDNLQQGRLQIVSALLVKPL